MNAGNPLTFAEVDGLAFAAERGRLQGYPVDHPLAARALGPFLELMLYVESGLLPPAHQAAEIGLGQFAAFEAAHRSGYTRWICPATRAAGFFRSSSTWTGDETSWIGFGLAAQKAAEASGFHHKTAAQFVSALGELVSNVHEHSSSPASGIAAFQGAPERFEFAVADRGIGILDSLRSCSAYAHLADHGEALRLALTEGISRFGPGSMRGYGFRPLFVGLANLSGYLRFRSGDHALVIDGQRIDMMAAKTAQKVYMRGFLASVVCRMR
ncbi:MAG: hypothetical protein QOF94_1432 [Acidobacteriaceae bacterium]|jgi:hypothetical protein